MRGAGRMQFGESARKQVGETDVRGVPWLEILLFFSCTGLLFQLIPSVLASVLAFASLVFGYLDVRGWTWRSYAVLFATVIVGLVALKAWLERDA